MPKVPGLAVIIFIYRRGLWFLLAREPKVRKRGKDFKSHKLWRTTEYSVRQTNGPGIWFNTSHLSSFNKVKARAGVQRDPHQETKTEKAQ